MATAKQIINSIKPNISKVPTGKTQLGSAGYDNVRDDIEKVKKIREGSIEKVPANDNDIANKKYVDDSFPVTHASTTGQTANDHHAQSHNIASHSDTSATGTELNTLTDNSIANTLHRHSELVASDGSPDPAISVDATGKVGVGTASPQRLFHLVGSDGAVASFPTGLGGKDFFILENNDNSNLSFITNAAKSSEFKFLKSGSTDTEGSIGYSQASSFMFFKTNQERRMWLMGDGKLGLGTSSPDTKLQVVGDFKSGDDNTNYLSLGTDGEVGLTGTARVTRHLRVGAGQWSHGASAPTAGFDGVFPYMAFDAASDDECHYTVIVPSRWDSSVDVEFVVDWYYSGAQDNGTVCWGVEYKSIKDGEAVTGAGTTITKTSAGTHTTGQMVRTAFTTKILAANLEYCDSLGLRLYRDVSADTLAVDARLINTHFHFTQNKLGKAT